MSINNLGTKFVEGIRNQAENVRSTENGGKGYATTKSHLVDLNFQTSSLRAEDESQIVTLFARAFEQDPEMSLRWVFFLRDVRGGMGERRSARIMMKYLATEYPKVLEPYLRLVPFFGRWDDMETFRGTKLDPLARSIIHSQWITDQRLYSTESYSDMSLMAKWMPNNNSRSAETKERARWWMKACGIEPTTEGAKFYRKTRAKFNKVLDVVEVKMSSKRFGDINYPAVPSRAAMIYRDAFMRHDEERYGEFINKVLSGDEKMNAGCVFPHEIVAKYPIAYPKFWLSDGTDAYNEFTPSLEALWKSFPSTHDDMCKNSNTLVVTDVSGSMSTQVPNSTAEAWDVSIALSLYFAERLEGPFKDKSILFSSKPSFLDFSSCETLQDKLNYCVEFDDCSNTDIEATFDLILNTAIDNKLTQDELPENVLVISDMEFDCCVYDHDTRLFDRITDRFKRAGYKLPRLVFWNVISRSNTIPLTSNEMGVTLVSGFSPNVMRMVFSGILDPYEALEDVLYTERYKDIIIPAGFQY